MAESYHRNIHSKKGFEVLKSERGRGEVEHVSYAGGYVTVTIMLQVFACTATMAL